MQLDPLWGLREAHKKKKVVSFAGWIAEPGNLAHGTEEVPAASPALSVTLGCSWVQHPSIFVYGMRAFSPSFTARLSSLAHPLLSNDPSRSWTMQRRRQGMFRANGNIPLSCPWHRSLQEAQQQVTAFQFTSQDWGSLSGESSEPRAS